MLPPFFAVDFEGWLTGGLVWKWGELVHVTQVGPDWPVCQAPTQRHDPSKKAPEEPEPSCFHRFAASRFRVNLRTCRVLPAACPLIPWTDRGLFWQTGC